MGVRVSINDELSDVESAESLNVDEWSDDSYSVESFYDDSDSEGDSEDLDDYHTDRTFAIKLIELITNGHILNLDDISTMFVFIKIITGKMYTRVLMQCMYYIYHI
jgi:hypothetical protein